MFRIISIALTALFAASCIIATPVIATPSNQRSVPQIEADIRRIGAQLTKIDTELKAFPNFGGTVSGALAIHNDILALGGYLDTMNGHVVATGHPSVADAKSIISHVHDLVPLFKDCLAQIVDKKPAFQALPGGDIPKRVKADLTALGAKGGVLAQHLVENTPPDLVHAATDIASDIAGQFIIAINAYANV